MRLIVCFKKSDNTKYISHLDLQRTVDRALRRSGVNVLYTSGYNPHIQMSFAFALKVGITSNNEYLEVVVDDMIDVADAEKRITSSFPKGLEVNWVKVKKEGTKKLMASVAMARYTIILESACDLAKIKKTMGEILSLETMILEKKTKKGLREFDARPLIYKMNLDEKENTLDLLLAAQDPSTLDPNVLFRKILLEAGEKCEYNISRNDLYTIQNKKVFSLSHLAE